MAQTTTVVRNAEQTIVSIGQHGGVSAGAKPIVGHEVVTVVVVRCPEGGRRSLTAAQSGNSARGRKTLKTWEKSLM